LMGTWFIYNGTRSDSLGVILTSPPNETVPERDIETVSILGRNGDLTIDNGRWKNTTRSYDCVLLPRNEESYRSECSILANFLCPSAGYSRLEDSFSPDIFRLGRLVGGFDVKSVMELAGQFTAKFNCKPQRFLKTGERKIAFSGTGKLNNPTNCRALPLVYVYGSGAGSITLGATTVNITTMDVSPLIIDCEQMNAYTVNAAGAATNQNNIISAPTFPYLEPGQNVISWSGEIANLEIIPRWWTI